MRRVRTWTLLLSDANAQLLPTVLSSYKAVREPCWCPAVVSITVAPEGGDWGREDQWVISAVQQEIPWTLKGGGGEKIERKGCQETRQQDLENRWTSCVYGYIKEESTLFLQSESWRLDLLLPAPEFVDNPESTSHHAAGEQPWLIALGSKCHRLIKAAIWVLHICNIQKALVKKSGLYVQRLKQPQIAWQCKENFRGCFPLYFAHCLQVVMCFCLCPCSRGERF